MLTLVGPTADVSKPDTLVTSCCGATWSRHVSPYFVFLFYNTLLIPKIDLNFENS
jgi:hypothetical protein